MIDWLHETLPAWMFDPNVTAPIAVGAGILGLIVGIIYGKLKGRKNQ